MDKFLKLIPGQCYHIYNIGNNREDLFYEHKNYFYFLNQYYKYIYPIADTYAYSLLKNHFHILLQIKKEKSFQDTGNYDPDKLYLRFSNLFNSYSKSINKMYDRAGSLFEERFKRECVNSDILFKKIVRYIHLNPLIHGLTEDFRNYPYSSYNLILSDVKTKLARNKLLNIFGGIENFINYHNTVDPKLNYSFLETGVENGKIKIFSGLNYM